MAAEAAGEKAKEIALLALKQGFTLEQAAKLTGLRKNVVDGLVGK